MHIRHHILSAILLIVILLMAFTSCRYDGRMQRRLQTLDTLVDHQPDSVLELISCIDADSLTQADRMHLELLRAKAMNKAYVDFTTDSVMLQVADYYDRHGAPNQQMLAHYLLGCTYRDMGSAPKAIESYLEATSKADTTATDCDFRTLMLIHSQLSGTFRDLSIPEFELAEIRAALNLCNRIGDTISASTLEISECGHLLREGKYQECINVARKQQNKYLSQEDFESAYKMSVYLIKSYYELGVSDSVKTQLEFYSQLFDEPHMKRVIVGGEYVLAFFWAKYYMMIGDFPSAIQQYRHSLLVPQRTIHLWESYRDLAICYGRTSCSDSALKYMALYDSVSIQQNKNSSIDASIRAKLFYDYGVEQRIANRKSADANAAKTKYLWAISLAFLLVGLAGYLRYRQLLAQRRADELNLKLLKVIKERLSAESQLGILTYQKKEIEDILQEKSQKYDDLKADLCQINNEIELKNREVTELNRQIECLENLIYSDVKENANDDFLQSDIVNKFRKALTSKGYTIESAYWEQLQETINAFFPNFDRTINKYGKLSDTDLKVCMLVKAKFAPSEIDYLMKMKRSYATNARKRLHQSIFGIQGSGAEFDKKIHFIK